VDALAEILLVGCVTLAFVVLMELTIVTVSLRGLRTAQALQTKLAPVIAVMAQIPDDQIRDGSKFLQRKFREWSEAERRLEAQGL
jgi:hypothetical protein